MSFYTPLNTHTVENQVPMMGDLNWFDLDLPLQEWCVEKGAIAHMGRLHAFGAEIASAQQREQGELANRFPPELKTFDRFGHRVDEVDFHPAYHNLMRIAKASGIHSLPWTAERGGHVAHTALLYMLTQTEAGICCPLTMTYAGVPTLRHHEGLAGQWEASVLSNQHDARLLPPPDKTALMLGMAMTEKQGGSDVRANRTVATQVSGDQYTLTGHKWFCSAPMSDGFFTLAQTSKGLTCFLVPRFLPDGTKNRFYIQRLKDKLGNQSNASSEIEYDRTFAIRVGEEGRGVATIIEMVHHTRLDCATAAVGLMRQSLFQALHHTRHREAFGAKLSEQPLMRHVLAELSIEWEASLGMIFHIAESYDNAEDADVKALSRLSVAIGKYWTNKRCIPFVGEAMECLGGAGYVEESGMPRLFRESPLNGIWEGSGNVICLDVLRTFSKEPRAIQLLLADLEGSYGRDARYDSLLQKVKGTLATLAKLPQTEAMWMARWLTEHLALCMQAHQLFENGNPVLAEAFAATRLSAQTGTRAFGSSMNLDATAVSTLLERVSPLKS